MHSQLRLLNLSKSAGLQETGQWRVFSTCLRSLLVGFGEFPTSVVSQSESAEVLRGENAYQFLLEVVCGLQSPVLGETEVFGQFRKFVDGWPEQSSFFQGVFADVKTIRQAHLSHLGSQSYGSWVRRHVCKTDAVAIVGTGQLAQEITVWLRKQNSGITLYSQNAQAAKARLGQDWNVRDLNELGVSPANAWIIASPIHSRQLPVHRPQLVFDLRDTSKVDLIQGQARSFKLEDVFSKIEQGRQAAQWKIEAARQMITMVARERCQTQVIRPFGWDDLCA